MKEEHAEEMYEALKKIRSIAFDLHLPSSHRAVNSLPKKDLIEMVRKISGRIIDQIDMEEDSKNTVNWENG